MAATNAPHRPVPSRHSRPQGDLQRRRLLALVAANPGIHVQQAAALLGINWNTCYHHVRRLEATQQVSVRRAFGSLCLFDRQQGAAAPRLARLVLRDERNQALGDLLDEQEGRNQRALSEQLGLAPSVVHRRLKQMEAHGLVQRVANGREMLVFATEALQRAKATAAPAPLVPAAAPFDGLTADA